MLALDTNILIYSAQTAVDHRKPMALDIVARAALTEAVLPVQALAEFANACRNKGLLDPAMINRRITEWSENFEMVAAVAADVGTGLALVSRYKLAFYDAMLCATVRRAGAAILLSEDMHDGLDLDGLTILNPFAPANAERLADLLGPPLTPWS